jgi:hypothetical protein
MVSAGTRVLLHPPDLSPNPAHPSPNHLLSKSSTPKSRCLVLLPCASRMGWPSPRRQVTVGGGRPVARQARKAFLPSSTVTSWGSSVSRGASVGRQRVCKDSRAGTQSLFPLPLSSQGGPLFQPHPITVEGLLPRAPGPT